MSWQETMKAAEAAKGCMLSDRLAGEKEFKRLLAKHPGDGMVHFQRGLAYESLGEHDLATADVRKAKALFSKTEWKQLAEDVLARLATKSSPKDDAQKKGTSARNKKTGLAPKRKETLAKSRRVWVVHGRDARLRAGMFTFLQSLGLQPLDFLEARKRTKKSSPYVGEVLDTAFRHAQAVVVLLTPDDEARLRSDLQESAEATYEKSLTGQARPNVLFEAGMAFMSHRDRTILVQFGEVRPFSDIAGKHIIHMDNNTQKRHELASRLEDAGCPVNWKQVGWHTAGDLSPAPANQKPAVASATPDAKASDIQPLLTQRDDDSAVRGRIRAALEDKRFQWRTLKALAAAAGVSEDRAAEVIRADPQIRFGKSAKGETLVGLLFRVD